MKKAFISLLSTDHYLKGVLVLRQSLLDTGTSFPFIVLVSESVSLDTVKTLHAYDIDTLAITNFNLPELPERINQSGPTHWNYTFEKLSIFKLTQFEKIVFLDADMLVLENIDELFDKEHLSAVGPAGGKYPGNESYNGFNSGLMVIEPSLQDYNNLMKLLPKIVEAHKNCGDQDVIIAAFIDSWKASPQHQLDDKYNMIAYYADYYINNFGYSFLKKGSNNNIKILHFIGAKKPWMPEDSRLKKLANTLKKSLSKKCYFKGLVIYDEYLQMIK